LTVNCCVVQAALTGQIRVSADESSIKQPAAEQVKQGVHVTPEKGGRTSGGGAQVWRAEGKFGGRLPDEGGGRCLTGEKREVNKLELRLNIPKQVHGQENVPGQANYYNVSTSNTAVPRKVCR